jgi:hypothetical protein
VIEGAGFFKRLDDAAIDRNHPIEITEFEGAARTAEDVRAEVAHFRGEMLSKAYALERQLDNLITWHLFRLRFDSASGFFSEHILQSGAFGLQLKTRLATLIVREWDWNEDIDAANLVKRLNLSKARRDRVAHWPTTLRPIRLPGGQVVDFLPVMGNGDDRSELTTAEQAQWLSEIDAVEEALRNLCEHVFEAARNFPED